MIPGCSELSSAAVATSRASASSASGLGALLRRTAGAIATLFGAVLVFPALAEALPSPWNADVQRVLPGVAGQAILNVRHASDALSPLTGFALFVGYVVVVFAFALVSVARRDA